MRRWQQYQPRDEVLEFSEDMEHQLSNNDHKGHWSGCTNAYLLRRLETECRELRRELEKSRVKPERVIREAADVANFAMMIADNARQSGEERGT